MREGFYWGNSVSSMQTEGAWDKDGKGMSVYDIREPSEFASDWKVATDSYHRYQEDFEYMQNLGMNMYRFQISWSRVCPLGEGEFNQAGIDFYHQFIDDLIARGIEPMICLYHFDMPLHLANKYNGLINKKVVEAFARYGIKMVQEFGHKVKHWITFNEQNLYHMREAFIISGYREGNKTIEELYQIQHNVMMAHAYIANYIHEHTDCKVTGMLAYSQVYPATCHPEDVRMAREWDEVLNHNLLEAFTTGRYSNFVMSLAKRYKIDMNILPGELETLSKLRNDYISFSYYASTTIDHTKVPSGTIVNEYMDFGKLDNPHLETTEWNWQIDPVGMRDILNKIYNRYKCPIFPIENGIGVIESWDGKNEIQDDYRINYHKKHFQAIYDAMYQDGIDVMGYLGWGLIDILSSQGDMRKRYGVVFVNRENHDLKDLKRVPKKSYHWLKRVIASNGLKLE